MKRKVSHKQIVCLLSLLIVGISSCLVFSSCSRKGKSDASYEILVIHSFRKEVHWVDAINRGITDCLKEKKIDAKVNIVYLENQISSFEEQAYRIENILDESARPDLILVCEDQAANALFSSTNEKTYQLPILFTGVCYFDEAWLKGRNNVTGWLITPDYEKTFALIRSLYPALKGIAIDVGNSRVSDMAVKELEKQLKNIERSDSLKLQINNMDEGLGSTYLWNASFSNDYPRIMPAWNSFYSSRARSTEIPFFSVTHQGLEQGYLGGYITLPYDQGYEAANRAIDLLLGRPANSYPISLLPKKWVFDHPQLQLKGIKKEDLPAGSTLLNQEARDARNQLLASIGLTLLFLLSLSFVFIYLYQKAQAVKKRTQEELLGHRTRLKVVMESIREGVVSLDKEMNILMMNSAAMEILRLQEEESAYIGKNILSIVDVFDEENHSLQFFIEKVFRIDATITSSRLRAHPTAVNYSIPITGSISAIHQHGKLYGGVIIFEDISEDLAQQEFLALTLGIGDVSSWRLDLENRLITFDASFFTRYELEDDGTHSFTLDHLGTLIHPEDMELWRKVNEKLLSGEVNTLHFEMRAKVNGKDYEWWELRYTCLHPFTEGEYPIIFGLVRNVQEIKETLREIEKARDKAQLSDRLKSAFLANMSHEIRTPLNAIVGFSNVLASGEEFEPEERAVFMETIRNNCNLLLALISDVLDIAQIETGNMVFNEEECNLNEFINQILTTQRIIVPQHLELIGDIPEAPIFIVTDKLRLNQVITNLINNAVKFTEKGSVTVGYTLEKDKFIKFFVEDTGKGIPEGDLFNIFERFFKNDDFKQGAGLGLSICKMIVDRFQGTISVTSKEHVGSRFTVTLPYRKGKVNKKSKKER
ncbi:hypothetical protein LJB97_00840 [Parabacteroides sp. OttesenSCG-928-O15]|nr:hypothetical protein [Parabacteroides sp. OttesenSCG-928-O15]